MVFFPSGISACLTKGKCPMAQKLMRMGYEYDGWESGFTA
jgi:hypothetical protein